MLALLLVIVIIACACVIAWGRNYHKQAPNSMSRLRREQIDRLIDEGKIDD